MTIPTCYSTATPCAESPFRFNMVHDTPSTVGRSPTPRFRRPTMISTETSRGGRWTRCPPPRGAQRTVLVGTRTVGGKDAVFNSGISIQEIPGRFWLICCVNLVNGCLWPDLPEDADSHENSLQAQARSQARRARWAPFAQRFWEVSDHLPGQSKPPTMGWSLVWRTRRRRDLVHLDTVLHVIEGASSHVYVGLWLNMLKERDEPSERISRTCACTEHYKTALLAPCSL